MTEHICQEPGCGLEMERRFIGDEERGCPRNDDAHALCKRVAELERKLEEAKGIIFAHEQGAAGLARQRDEATTALRASQERELALREALQACYPLSPPHLWNAADRKIANAISDTSASAAQTVERIEREALEKFFSVITDPGNEIVWVRPSGRSIHADPRFIRAAILGEKEKG